MSLVATILRVEGRLGAMQVMLNRREVTAILGPNGAGKSTLLAALAGLHAQPVTLDGRPLADMPASLRARAIGYLPQSGEVAWNLSVETLAGLGRLPHRAGPNRTSPQQDRAAVDAALAALDLTPLARRPLSRLSGGERARALLARVLAGQPDWVLADEPLASLDLAHQQALLARFSMLAANGQGVALVLHDLAHAMNHAHRVIVLDRGTLIATGHPETVLTPALIEQVWGLKSRWLGEPGARALGF